MLSKNNPGTLLMIGCAALGVLIVLLFVFSKTADPKKAHSAASKRPSLGQTSGSADQQHSKSITPADQMAPSAPNLDESVTASDIEKTKNPLGATNQASPMLSRAPTAGANPDGVLLPQGNAAAGSRSGKQQLGDIPPFQQPPINPRPSWTPQPYDGQPYSGSTQATTAAMNQEALRASKEEVTKASMVFTQRRQQPVTHAAAGPAITNFGLEPGFHVAVRLEASASTAVQTPVTAVVEYNYQRNGQILIPAGSRAIGKIVAADDAGIMSISFSSIELSDEYSVPISAVAVDTNLQPVKGIVNGRNRAKAMVVSTLTGIGQAAAMLVGNNNMNGAYSQTDMIRERVAQNAGNAGDMQIMRLAANEHIVVTVSAGTELYMVFTKPAPVSSEAAAAPAHQ